MPPPMSLEIGPLQLMLGGLRRCSRGGGCENYPRFALTSNQNLVPIVSKLRELIELLKGATHVIVGEPELRTLGPGVRESEPASDR